MLNYIRIFREIRKPPAGMILCDACAETDEDRRSAGLAIIDIQTRIDDCLAWMGTPNSAPNRGFGDPMEYEERWLPGISGWTLQNAMYDQNGICDSKGCRAGSSHRLHG